MLKSSPGDDLLRSHIWIMEEGETAPIVFFFGDKSSTGAQSVAGSEGHATSLPARLRQSYRLHIASSSNEQALVLDKQTSRPPFASPRKENNNSLCSFFFFLFFSRGGGAILAVDGKTNTILPGVWRVRRYRADAVRSFDASISVQKHCIGILHNAAARNKSEV